MFGSTPSLAALVFGPPFAGLCLYTAFTAVETWRRVGAIVLLAGVVAVNLIRKPQVLVPTIRWVLGICLVAISGGAESPLLPFLLISVLYQATVLGGRAGVLQCATSIVAVWVMTLLEGHGVGTVVRAATMTPLLVAALLVGTWIRELSEQMVRSSLEARDELVRAYDERIRDLSSIQSELAHALKNPLASIKGLAGLTALEPDRAPERMKVMQQEICRMQSILDECLSFARPLTPLQPRPIRAREVLCAVAKLHEGMATEKKVTLDVSSADAVELVGDPHKVKQMLVSLIVNAIEASRAGDVVELTSRRDGDRIVLGVLDHGPGICAELLPRVAEPGVTTKPDGTGLGLTIVRAFAEQHGGALRLRNREGGGLAAEIELPMRCSMEHQARPLA